MEPQKFFLGVIDFFSVLLPGALLTYLLKDDMGPFLLGDRYRVLEGTEQWMVFFFGSYLLGHFIFLIGSWLDGPYDTIRNATDAGQIERLAKGKKLSPGLARWLAAHFFKKDADNAVRQAVQIKEHYLDPLQASSAINAFQWSKARLTLEHPEAAATVHRFEADSKFFRSLLVVLCILIPWGVAGGQPGIAFVSVLLLVPAFWRFVDQRLKATSQAYWYVITLEGSKPADNAFRQLLPARAGGPSRAGGVVFRLSDDQVEYLLVQAKNAPREWVLPKGHIEPGEEREAAAVREVREETGVWASVRKPIKVALWAVGDELVQVQFYLMEAAAEGKPKDKGREHEWLPLREALNRVTHSQSREVLSLAEQMRTSASTNYNSA